MIEAVKVPEAVGVPLMVPALLIERPLGRPLADQLYGETPPVAASVAEYAVPTVPAGRVVVEITSGAGGPVGKAGGGRRRALERDNLHAVIKSAARRYRRLIRAGRRDRSIEQAQRGA